MGKRSKAMKRTVFIFLLTAALALGLADCGGGGSLGEVTQHAPAPESADAGGDASGGVLIREDEDGLVAVRIEEGDAEISFDIERWGELNTGQDQFGEGPFPIETLSGNVKDAVVGKVESMDFYNYWDIVTPAAALLTEDGRVEYIMADPYEGWQEDRYISHGILPWLTDIVSLEYGYKEGNRTIYAFDSTGNQYDISLVNFLVNVFDEDGMWEFFTPSDWGGELYCGVMLNEDGSMFMVIGNKFEGGDVYETEQTYDGTYEVFLSENSGTGVGVMDIDLTLTWWTAEMGEGAEAEDYEYWEERQTIAGPYSFSATGDGFLNLRLMYGDALMHTGWRGEPIESYNFWQTTFFDR